MAAPGSICHRGRRTAPGGGDSTDRPEGPEGEAECSFPAMRTGRALAALIVVTWGLSGCASSSPFAGLTAGQLYDLGLAKYEEEDWSEAIRAFERLTLAFPTYDRIAEARIYLSRSFFEKEEYLSAASEYTRFLDRYPGHELAPQASLGTCLSYAELSPIPQRDQTYTHEAIDECLNVTTDYPGTPEAEQAMAVRAQMVEKLARKVWLGGDWYFRRKLYDSAIIYFQDVVETYPETDAAPEAWLRLYQSYEQIGYDDEAQQARDQLLQRYPDSQAARSLVGNGP